MGSRGAGSAAPAPPFWPWLWGEDASPLRCLQPGGPVEIRRKPPIGIHVFVEQRRQRAAIVLAQVLQELMLRSFHQMRQVARTRRLYHRTAALSMGVEKVAKEKARRGLYP